MRAPHQRERATVQKNSQRADQAEQTVQNPQNSKISHVYLQSASHQPTAQNYSSSRSREL